MLDGLKRIVNSAKVQLLASAAVSAVLTYLFTPGTTADKRGLLETMIVALASLVGAVILGWAHEDASAKAAPTNQTNVNSDVRNTPATPVAAPPEPQTAVPPVAELSDAEADAIINRLAVRQKALRESHETRPHDVVKGT